MKQQYSTEQKFLRAEITAQDRWRDLYSRWSPVIAACTKAELSASRRMAPKGARPNSFAVISEQKSRERMGSFEFQVMEHAARSLRDLYGNYWFRKDAYRMGLENPANWAIANAERAVFFKGEVCPCAPSSAWANAFTIGVEMADSSLAFGDECAWKSVAERKFEPELLRELAEERGATLEALLASVVRHVSDTIADAPVDERPAMKLAASAIAYAAAESWEYEALGELVAGWEPTPDLDEAEPEEQAPAPGM